MDSFENIMEFTENEFSHGGVGLGTNGLVGSYFQILRVT